MQQKRHAPSATRSSDDLLKKVEQKTDMVFEILGFAGTILIVGAYLPVVRHLVKERCSVSVSVRAWIVWLAAAILLFGYAWSINDTVFITLQAIHMVAIVVVLGLANKYRRNICTSCKRGKSYF